MMAGQLLASRYELGERLGVGGMSTVAARLRPPARAPRRRQAARRAPRRGPAVRLALPPRGAGRRAPRAPEHRAGLRLRARRGDRPPLHRHGVRPRASPARRSCASAGRLPVDEALDIVAQACRGLDYAHRNGVVHRDVKPGQPPALRRRRRQARRLRHRQGGQRGVVDHPGRLGARHRRLPRAGAGAGRGGRPAADIYALGVVDLPAAQRPPALRGGVADRARAQAAARGAAAARRRWTRRSRRRSRRASTARSRSTRPTATRRAEELREALEDGAARRRPDATARDARVAADTAATRHRDARPARRARPRSPRRRARAAPAARPAHARPAPVAAGRGAPRRGAGAPPPRRIRRLFATLLRPAAARRRRRDRRHRDVHDSNAVHLREVTGDRVQTIVQQIKDLVDANTR